MTAITIVSEGVVKHDVPYVTTVFSACRANLSKSTAPMNPMINVSYEDRRDYIIL